MKCPLILTKESPEGELLFPTQGDCLKEECAWWSKDEPECVLQTMDYRLGDIAHWLSNVAKELSLIRPGPR